MAAAPSALICPVSGAQFDWQRLVAEYATIFASRLRESGGLSVISYSTVSGYTVPIAVP
jgi:hypothetical protein